MSPQLASGLERIFRGTNSKSTLTNFSAHFELMSSRRLRPDALEREIGQMDRSRSEPRRNDETERDIEDEVPKFTLHFPSWRG